MKKRENLYVTQEEDAWANREINKYFNPEPKPSRIMKTENLYWNVLKVIKHMPYCIRIIFWKLLYKYNKRKYPNGTFTLTDYIEYANKR